MATRDYSCQSKLHKEHAYGVFGFSTQRIVSPREELCCGDMSCGDFQAFVLLLLAAYCLGDLSKTNSIPLTCYSNENCEANSLCNQTCSLNQYCYAFWTNNSGNVSVSKQGCWIDDVTVNNCETATCKHGIRIKKQINNFYFCCCNKDICNDELGLDPEVYVAPNSTSTYEATTGPSTLSTVSPTTATKNKTIQTLLYSVLPIFGVAVFIVFGFFMYHRRKTSFPHIFEEPLRTLPPPSPDLGVRPIQLVEIISQGQFGTVWKADYLQDVVAVKVFPSSYKAAWACEKEIFMTRNMKHENILNFIAAEKHTDGQYVELWLVTQYHENGSLGDYLKSHVVNWRELCCMAGSMANGLAYLHTEIHETFKFKPCIAHRDFKSKNVLVKKDLTCCLSDFGLAVRFQSGGDPGEMHGQVGTRRYMAPEVLEGAINFTRESFLYIDVYAFALVLWELASRCSAVDGPVEDYQLPFEEEVGSHPSLEDMQQAVVHKKIRPRFRADWLIHPGMSNLLQTIEECWDQDAEARLTAQCVAERMTHCQMMPLLGTEQMPAITTVVNDTHIPMSSKESTI